MSDTVRGVIVFLAFAALATVAGALTHFASWFAAAATAGVV